MIDAFSMAAQSCNMLNARYVSSRKTAREHARMACFLFIAHGVE
ncbi:Uncharacterized protein ChrSV_2686 [Chromobacterium vaccinii]|nr:Uncharacterized protein ChrSW_2686 [Chromobacterium vaccinii]QND90143.1 Uncharacterized protein ChrSV_2686 [Chromobacterium vaccinii]